MTLVGWATLSGCQSAPALQSSHNNRASVVGTPLATMDESDREGIRAKQELIDTIDNMLRRSYAYDSNFTISNANRRAALDKATPEQLAAANSRYDHCEHVHDTAYAEVLSDAQLDGYELSEIQEQVNEGLDNEYTIQLEQLKQEYITCYNEYNLWEIAETKREMEEYNLWLDEEYGEEAEQEEIEQEEAEQEEAEQEEAEDGVENSDDEIEIESAENEEPELPEFMKDYDYNHTELSAIQADLLDAYLLQRLHINNSGVYRAYSGRFTMLPQVSYQGRNLELTVNQPIFIDLRRGELYLWADTLALVVSEYLDNELGVNWKNKWLKISFDDDTLPDGYAKDLLKAHIDASQHMIEQDNNANFSYVDLNSPVTNSPVTNSTVNSALISLDAENTIDLAQLTDTNYVIQHTQKMDEIKQSSEAFYKYIYETMTTLYPDFLEDDEEYEDESDEECTTLDVASETAEEVSETTDDAQDSDIDNIDDESSEEVNEDDELLTAKMVVEAYMHVVEHMANIEDEEKDESQDTLCDNNKVQDDATAEGSTEDEVKNDIGELKENTDEKEKVYKDDAIKMLNQYGYDSRGDLVWSRYQLRINSNDDYDSYQDNGEGVVLSFDTTYSPITSQTIAYPNLPLSAQTPTSANTIDLMDYSKDLKQRYREGGGATFGRMIFASYFRYYDDYDEYESIEHDEAEIEEADAEEADADTEIDNNETNSDEVNTETLIIEENIVVDEADNVEAIDSDNERIPNADNVPFDNNPEMNY